MQAVLEEFGKWIKPGTTDSLANRNAFYAAVFQQVQNVCSSSGASVILAGFAGSLSAGPHSCNVESCLQLAQLCDALDSCNLGLLLCLKCCTDGRYVSLSFVCECAECHPRRKHQGISVLALAGAQSDSACSRWSWWRLVWHLSRRQYLFHCLEQCPGGSTTGCS